MSLTVVSVALCNPCNATCTNYVEISGMNDDDMKVCYKMIISN